MSISPTEARRERYAERNLGKGWHSQTYYKRVYNMTDVELIEARMNGLPAERRNDIWFYQIDQFHDYYAGKIGNDVK